MLRRLRHARAAGARADNPKTQEVSEVSKISPNTQQQGHLNSASCPNAPERGRLGCRGGKEGRGVSVYAGGAEQEIFSTTVMGDGGGATVNTRSQKHLLPLQKCPAFVYAEAYSSIDCIEPGLKYPPLAVDHSSECSIRCIVMSLVYESSFGNIPTTLLLRRISRFRRSSIFVDDICAGLLRSGAGARRRAGQTAC